jgi:glucosamine-phosphate N-acetyltransferase
METILIRDFDLKDINNYIELMKVFPSYGFELDNDLLFDSLNNNKNRKIFVIENKLTKELIGAATLFKLEKIHNFAVGQIEDVVINEKFRKNNYGKLLIDYLVKFSLEQWNCYKIILNCSEQNIPFYEKCGFQKSSVQMRLNK